MLFEFSTPIRKLDWKGCDANIYIKRDDLIGFSFGGNKVRIAAQYLEDMRSKGCDCMIAYGSTRSNMCRVAANMCCGENIPCYVVTALSEGEELKDTFNSIRVSNSCKPYVPVRMVFSIIGQDVPVLKVWISDCRI